MREADAVADAVTFDDDGHGLAVEMLLLRLRVLSFRRSGGVDIHVVLFVLSILDCCRGFLCHVIPNVLAHRYGVVLEAWGDVLSPCGERSQKGP